MHNLIKKIHSRAVELQKKSLQAAIDEGSHRSSTNDEYYRGGADALLSLARELEAGTASSQSQPANSTYPPLRYWGIYFPKIKHWLQRSDGSLFFYPSPAIAQAHFDEIGDRVMNAEVREFTSADAPEGESKVEQDVV